jgi:plastocyanin
MARARVVPALLILAALIGSAATAEAQVVNGCQPTQYLDRTASADREITWDFGVEADPERCMQVQTGQTVVWNTSDFELHPLSGVGGDVPNPISSHQNGSVTFTTPGTFGFVCDNHTVMRGAIKVVQAPAAVPAFFPWLVVALSVALLASGWALTEGHRRRRGARA